MIGFKFISAFGLLGAALAQTDSNYFFSTNVTNYVYNNDIDSDGSAGTASWDMKLLSSVKSVKISGSVTLPQNFRVTASEPNQGLDFGYYGGDMNVYDLIFDDQLSASPLHFVFEGGSLTAGKTGEIRLIAPLDQPSSGYFDFPDGITAPEN